MQQATPSRTALRVALRRAAHQLYDTPLVFPDPLAIPILGPACQEELRRTPTRSDRPHSTSLRAFLVARSRYAEDTLHRAAANGLSQYVLLGAGLDTFAYRNPYSQLSVYEVDHPATQAWKRTLLTQAAIPIPPSLTYVPVDFERQSLAAELAAPTFNPARPSLFAWLGVVPYLTLEAFRSTVAFIAQQPAGTTLVFDYAQPRRVLPYLEQLAHDSLAARVAQAGEPFQLFFTPAEIAAELQTIGAFHSIEDLGAPEINARYFTINGTPRPDNLRILGQAGRLLSAKL